MHKETQKSQKIAVLVLTGAVIDLQFKVNNKETKKNKKIKKNLNLQI